MYNIYENMRNLRTGHFPVGQSVGTGQFAGNNTMYIFRATILKSLFFTSYESFLLLLFIPATVFIMDYQKKE